MKSFTKYSLLCIMLYAGAVRCQNSLRFSLEMKSDTIRNHEDISFKVTIQSTYPDKIPVSPSVLNGTIRDTLRYIYYQLLRKEGKEFIDVPPAKYNLHLDGDRFYAPDTLTRFKPIVFNDYLNYFHIKKGEYKFRIVCAVVIKNVARTFFSEWSHFYCTEHFYN